MPPSVFADVLARHTAMPNPASAHRHDIPVSVSASARHYDAIVAGAGSTGLSAAYHLDRNTLLLDKNATVGGWYRSATDRGFVFDCAGHALFSDEPYVRQLYKLLLGDNLHWQNREAAIVRRGTQTRHPLSPAGPVDGSAQNLEDFIYSAWGTGARHFAIPYHRKLWTVPLTEMETSWLGGRVPSVSLEELIDGGLQQSSSPNSRFGYPLRGGIQALMDGFLSYIRGDVQLSAEIVHVSPARRMVTLADGRQFRYRNLISTMPLPELIKAVGDEVPDAVRRAAQALRHVSLRCVNLGVARANVTDKHWIYYPEDSVFHRVFAQGNASPHCSPEGGFGLTCEITYSPTKPLPAEGEALINRCVADAVRVGLLREDDQLIVTNQVDIPYAYVIPDQTRARNVSLIRNWLDQYDIFLAGYYSEWEHHSSDHAFIAGKKVAQTVKENSYRSQVIGI
jgi:UDP-galactopyranose mutase